MLSVQMIRRLALLVATTALLAAATAAPSWAKPWIGVQGNQLVDQSGNPVRLLGVNRSGTEYQCEKDNGIFEGPDDAASIAAMKSWQINAVRVPLNESCWLGINGISPSLRGTSYREAIHAYVERLERAGLYVILDLHWASPRTYPSAGIIPMPDAEHSPDLWRSVATEYRNDRSVIFDLYNEPRPGVPWPCWESGCEIEDHWVGYYPAVGMQQLIEVVRSTGALQPVMLGGVDWARNLDGWLAHLPPDPANAEVASNHTYDFSICKGRCRATLLQIAQQYPVVTGELGEGDCMHRYIDGYMRWADLHGISYLGWAWNTDNGWTCRSGPSLIKDYSGRPTNFGVGFRDHLRDLAREPVPMPVTPAPPVG
jgi:aryl-phospho-beta-D-glucosidase BglC (GH1 family)